MEMIMIFRLIAVCTFTCFLTAGTAFSEDLKAGKKVFKKCKSCHTVKPEKHKVGPSLYKVVDQTAGAAEGYKYSPALKSSGLTWDLETLTAFLKNPKEVIPGNKMSFPGLKNDEDITNLIAYIQSKSE